jgi:hypothetical protein
MIPASITGVLAELSGKQITTPEHDLDALSNRSSDNTTCFETHPVTSRGLNIAIRYLKNVAIIEWTRAIV